MQSLRPQPLDPGQFYQQEVARLPDGSRWISQIPEPNPKNENSCVAISYQIGQYNLDMVLLDVLARIAQEPMFSRLRTREQLGYIVHVDSQHASAGVQALILLIQSDKYDPVYLQQRIEDFLAHFEVLVHVIVC